MPILNARCKICNRVSSELIETNLGDFTKKRFFRDDEHQDVLCEECKEIHEDLMLDYESQDDPWRHYSNDNSKRDQEISVLVGPDWSVTEADDDTFSFEFDEEEA
jgi:hypothetical protein